jgi:hypothetical protein
METSNLKTHLVTCVASCKQAQLLASFGITGSSPSLSPEDVRKHVALWMAENAQSFLTVKDHHVSNCCAYSLCNLMYFQFCMLINLEIHKHLPHHDTISQDIRHIYEATQQVIVEYLAVSTNHSRNFCHNSIQ